MLQIRGASFGVSDYTCVFGNDNEARSTKAQHVGAGLLECPIPPAPAADTDGLPVAGPTSLHIASAVGFVSNRLQFTYFIPPTLLGVVPSFGSTDGGTRVIAAGIGFEGFWGGVSCSFGGVETPGEVVSATEVACSSPAAFIGGFGAGSHDDPSRFVPLLVTVNGLHYGADTGARSTGIDVVFEYTDTPVISFISPVTGPPDLGGYGDGDGNGGSGTLVSDERTATYLKVHGAHFREGANLACRFGALLTAAVYVSPSEVDCLIPPMSTATGDKPTVAVTANGVDFSREGPPSTTFTYVARPVLVGMLPAMGPSTGGSTVTVVGSNFVTGALETIRQASLVCRFDLENVANFTSNDDGSSTSGGDLTHTLHWDVTATVESDSSATCVSPAVVASLATAVSGGGYATVKVSTDGGSSFSSTSTRFYFYQQATVSSVTPTTMPASGGGDITVSGQGFLLGEGLLLCQYEATAAISLSNASELPEGASVLRAEGGYFSFTTVAIWLSPELLRCELPPLDVEFGAYLVLSVRVTNNGVDFSPSVAQLYVYASPGLSSINPATGPRTGGTPVKLAVDGWGLPVADARFEVRCQWGKNVSTPGELSPVTSEMTAATGGVFVACTSPLATTLISDSTQESGVSVNDVIEVTLQIDGREVGATGPGATAAGISFTFYDAPIVLDVSPTAGRHIGGTDVVITGSGFSFGAPGKAGAGQTVCMFGESDVVYAAIVSDAELRCRSPPFSGGSSMGATGTSVDLQVSMNGGLDYSWPPSVSFQYLPIASTTGELNYGRPTARDNFVCDLCEMCATSGLGK